MLSRKAGDHERAAEYLARAARAEQSSAGAQQTKDTWQEVIDELAGISGKQELLFEARTATAEAQVQLYEAGLEGEVKRAVTVEKKALTAAKTEREEGGGGGGELPDAVDGAAVRRRAQVTLVLWKECELYSNEACTNQTVGLTHQGGSRRGGEASGGGHTGGGA